MSARLRLMSANLGDGDADPEAFAALVAALEPDVVAVQELAPTQVDALAQLLPFGTLAPAYGYKGMGIALRRAGIVWRLPLPYRDAFVAELALGEEPVEVINVHITAPHAWPFWRAPSRRRGQLRGLVGHFDTVPERPRVVVGDFNATPLWPLYRQLTARFTDAALEVARRNGGRVQATWGPGPGVPRLLRIDHALISGLAVQDLRVVPLEGSDHSALVVDLSLGAPDPGPA